MAALMNMRHSASLCSACFRSLSKSRPARASIVKPRDGRRWLASMSPESQHKVDGQRFETFRKLTITQLLADNLESADPDVFEILQKVRCKFSATVPPYDHQN